MLRDVAYQSNTPMFWSSMDMIGGKSSYWMGGAFNDGKGEPSQSNSEPRLRAGALPERDDPQHGTELVMAQASRPPAGSSQLLSREAAKALTDRVLMLSSADQTRVTIVSTWSGNTRFADAEHRRPAASPTPR